MKRLLLVALAYCFVATSASLSNASEATDCAKIDDPDSRLNCYDRLFRVTAPSSEVVVGVGKWEVSSTTSKIDDSKNVYLRLEADNEVLGRYGDRVRVTMTVTCRENVTSLWFNFGGHFMSDYQYGTITYRVDDKKAKRKKFRESTNNEALGLWNGGSSIPFLKLIMSGKHLLVRATPYSESAIDSEFEIAGLENALKPLREACGW